VSVVRGHASCSASIEVRIVNSRILMTSATTAIALNLTACQAVKFVFNAGFVTGIVVVFAVLVGIGYAVSRAL
jgi:hypothetical protein